MDRGPFGEDLALREFERRNVAFRVDREKILAARGLLRLDVDLLELEVDSSLARDDVRRERASAGRVVELHGGLLRVVSTVLGAPQAVGAALRAAQASP